ncbi:MAG: crotonobetaine/carnitine-CoA ligase, partial [Parasphingorhabdus sp.]
DVIKYRATITNSLGVVSAFILNQPESDLDRKHSLRTMGMAPNSPAQELGLRERFGIQNVVGMYGMTEVNIPLYTPLGVSRPDTCGKVWEEFYEVEIVNPETDEICKRGETGEIVVRSRQPFGFMLGYLNMPEKTVEAWRNFWFHTGDAAWMDAEGYVFFVDRIKDCIRRRGENISSYQIETCIAEHPAIDEVAAYAVPSEISGDDEEIMIAFVQAPTAAISFEEIAEFSAETMPTFSIPRYFRQLDALPKTPTGKVQKHLLKTQAITKDSWDRQSPKSAIKP